MESGITAEECDRTALHRDPALRGVLQELGIIKHEIIDYGTDEGKKMQCNGLVLTGIGTYCMHMQFSLRKRSLQ